MPSDWFCGALAEGYGKLSAWLKRAVKHSSLPFYYLTAEKLEEDSVAFRGYMSPN